MPVSRKKAQNTEETPEVAGAELVLDSEDEEIDADQGEFEDDGPVASAEAGISDDDEAGAPSGGGETDEDSGEPVVSVRLNADLRRRLRRMAQRQGVRPEEVARLLLAQALMNPAGDPVDALLVRVDKLEKRVAELATASSARPAATGDRFNTEDNRPPRRSFDSGGGSRRDDFAGSSRPPFQDDRGPRPPRGDVDRNRRPFGDRQGYGDRQGSGYGDRPNRNYGDRPAYSRPRDFDSRPPRRDWDERPPRRNWDERPQR